MGIITTSRRQNAIYWPPAVSNDYGELVAGTLVELVNDSGNYRVRWVDKNDTFVDSQGTTQTSISKVAVPLLPDGSEVVVGGVLWLGDRADLTSETDPLANDGAHEVRRVEHIPNLKASETLRVALL